MTKQTQRQEARKAAVQRFQQRREEIAAREARIRDLAVDAAAAVVEKQQCDQRIARAVHELTVNEKLPAADVAELLDLPPKDISRLRKEHQAGTRRPVQSHSEAVA